jgi:hypothetical protein
VRAQDSVATEKKVNREGAPTKFRALLTEHTDPWYFEFMLFFYEQTTALLCRVLQLSIDDRDTAIFCSVFGAIAEMAVRVFYFQLFLSHGLKKDGQWDSDEEIYNYALRGKLRAQDR